MNVILSKYKEELITQFVHVCENEGYTVDRDQLDFNDVLDVLLSGCVSNMEETLDDDINNGLLGEIEGVNG